MRYIRNTLVMPGNNPSMLLKSISYGADSLILDLEDAVSPNEKDAARRLLVAHLKFLDWGDTQVIVRVNPMDTEMFMKDMEAVLPLGITAVTVPKVESAEQIREVERIVAQYEPKDCPPTEIIPVIETPLGVLRAEEIACASQRNCAITLGAADYTSAIGAQRSEGGQEFFFARAMVVNACAIAGIMAMDTPCMELDDMDVIYRDSLNSRRLGFSCKVCINPRQIPMVNAAFTPDQAEIEWAKRILVARDENEAKGIGVYAVDGKMVDRPVVLRAEKVMSMANAFGLTK